LSPKIFSGVRAALRVLNFPKKERSQSYELLDMGGEGEVNSPRESLSGAEERRMFEGKVLTGESIGKNCPGEKQRRDLAHALGLGGRREARSEKRGEAQY